tara:strand:- start:599 stop:772 length:174 start_codon:yes stop_codon:yes gene_type:complete
MNITKAQYMKGSLESANSGIKATIDGQETHIPLDTDNLYYQAIQEWVAAGNTIEEAD